MKKIIYLLAIISIVSCQKQMKSDQVIGNGPNNPPPPPSQEFINKVQQNTPPLEKYIKALKNLYKNEGKSEEFINKEVNKFKENVKSQCGDCYETIKDLK